MNFLLQVFIRGPKSRRQLTYYSTSYLIRPHIRPESMKRQQLVSSVTYQGIRQSLKARLIELFKYLVDLCLFKALFIAINRHE